MQQYYSKNRLTISESYQIIKEKLQSGDYTTSNTRDINPHLEDKSNISVAAISKLSYTPCYTQCGLFNENLN